jgi:hypothetical protein
MKSETLQKLRLWRGGVMAVSLLLATAAALAEPPDRTIFVLTSTNDPSNNAVEVFRLNIANAHSLSLVGTLPTGGKGGASNNAGILQFRENLGAVANWGSNNVSQLIRTENSIAVVRTIKLIFTSSAQTAPRVTAGLRASWTAAWSLSRILPPLRSPWGKPGRR